MHESVRCGVRGAGCQVKGVGDRVRAVVCYLWCAVCSEQGMYVV